MNESMIARYNSVVSHDDTVYHLGDFAFAKPNRIIDILARLNGKKHLILGNHDDTDMKKSIGLWESIQHYKEIFLDGHRITLMHYSMKVFNKSHHGALMLYGHSHGSLPGNNQSLDVGVDCWDYTPVTLNQILDRMKTLPPYTTQDHHTVTQSIAPTITSSRDLK